MAAPKSAITHIQNTAPGPPTAIADATPARLPVPTRAPSDTQNAWKEEMPCPLRRTASLSRPNTPNIARHFLNWNPLRRYVRPIDTHTSSHRTHQPHSASFAADIHLKNVSIKGSNRCSI